MRPVKHTIFKNHFNAIDHIDTGKYLGSSSDIFSKIRKNIQTYPLNFNINLTHYSAYSTKQKLPNASSRIKELTLENFKLKEAKNYRVRFIIKQNQNAYILPLVANLRYLAWRAYINYPCKYVHSNDNNA